MIGSLKSYIMDNWQDLLPDTRRPSDLSFMLQGSRSYRLPYTKVIVLLFRPGDSRPVLVGKVADDPAFGGIVEKEFADIKRMHEGPYPDVIKAALPKPLALERIGRDTVMIETAVAGESMSLQMLRNARRDQYTDNAFADALAWLTQMRDGELNCADAVAQATRVVEGVLGFYDELYSPQGEEKAALADAWETVRPLIGNGLPVVPAHGDFWVDNVFRQDRRVVGVIDWEYARPASMPVWDLFQFEFSMGIAAHGKIDLPGIFDTAFFKECSLRREFANVLRSYCTAYGIEFSPRVIEALFVLWIAETAVKERELFGRSYETDMLRHVNMRIYLENRRPDWGTFAG
jgi:aminoglycoside phosphotransferase (APT) family kinase protein